MKMQYQHSRCEGNFRMDSPPLGLGLRSNLPYRLMNGSSPLQLSVSTQERQKLAASIQSSSYERQAVDLEAHQDVHVNGDNSYHKKHVQITQGQPSTSPSELARDPRDNAAPLPSRPASPYTLNPPIDFDGLSWPSECWEHP